MRHRVAYRKLGRVTEHRLAMLRNQATALLLHEHVTTTVPRAKELRPFVERLITIAKRGIANGGNGGASHEEAAAGRALHARRLVLQDLVDREVVSKLFDTIAPRFADRPGGYTRLLRIGYRRGDSAEMAQVELLGSEFNPRAKAEGQAKAEGEKSKSKGVGGRLRAAAERLRGGKKADASAASEAAAATEAQAAKRSAGRKSSASRKMGGSSKGK
jgi:large subunit ribosomal protein L17